jgi:hypothetical protein
MQAVPLEFIAQARPAVVEVRGAYGARVIVANPRVTDDTIRGTTPGGFTQVAVPLREVGSISTKRFSKSRTLLLVGGGAALTAIATFFIIKTGNSPPELDCGIDNPIDPNDREKCGV